MSIDTTRRDFIGGNARAPWEPTPQPSGSEPLRLQAGDLLSAQQVADVLGKSVRYIYRLAREGKLAKYKPPGTKYVYFRRSDVEAFLRRGRKDVRR